MIKKIVSGGQTGADRAALDFAIAHGIPHGGWCPKGRLAEDGSISGRYHLLETSTSHYAERTEKNVQDSDATVIFTMASKLRCGSKSTAEFATRHKKPWIHLFPGKSGNLAAELIAFVESSKIEVLNIAGSRASEEPAVGELVRETLEQVKGRLF